MKRPSLEIKKSLDKNTSEDLHIELVTDISDKLSVREKMRNLYIREFSEKDL